MLLSGSCIFWLLIFAERVAKVKRKMRWKRREPEANKAQEEREAQREDGDAPAQLEARHFLRSCKVAK